MPHEKEVKFKIIFRNNIIIIIVEISEQYSQKLEKGKRGYKKS